MSNMARNFHILLHFQTIWKIAITYGVKNRFNGFQQWRYYGGGIADRTAPGETIQGVTPD